MGRLALFLILANISVVMGDEPSRMPGIGFFGLGYNIYLGNPHTYTSGSGDPGFQVTCTYMLPGFSK